MAENFDDFNIDVRTEQSYNLQRWREDYRRGRFEMVTENNYIELRKSTVTHEKIMIYESIKKSGPDLPRDLRWEEFPYLSQEDFQNDIKCGKEREQLNTENDRKGRLVELWLEKLRLQPAIEWVVPNQLEIPLNVVVVGKTGSGKNATSNTILGVKGGFKEDVGTEGVTEQVEIKVSNWNGINVQVIDTTGLLETNTPMERRLKAISRVVVESPNGVHAFIFVVTAHSRFTEGDLESQRQLKLEFGEEFDKHSMLVFSFGKTLIDKRSSVTQLCENLRSQGEKNKKFIESFGNRIIAVDNKSDILAIQQRNRKSLISMALNLSQNCQSAYTETFFETAQQEKKKIKLSELGEIIFSLIRSKIRDESSFIKQVDQLEVSDEFMREIQEKLPLHGLTYTYDEIKNCAVDVMKRETRVFEAVYRDVEGFFKSTSRKCIIL